jgi:hypothetical protein
MVAPRFGMKLVVEKIPFLEKPFFGSNLVS